MKWWLNYADKVKSLEAIAKSTGNMPEALANKPELTRHALPFYSAFMRLTTSGREIGYSGYGPILMSEIKAFADMNGVYGREERMELIHYVQICDDVFMESMNARRNKDATIRN